MAKDLVRIRKHQEKFVNLTAQLRAISLQMTVSAQHIASCRELEANERAEPAMRWQSAHCCSLSVCRLQAMASTAALTDSMKKITKVSRAATPAVCCLSRTCELTRSSLACVCVRAAVDGRVEQGDEHA